MPASRPKPEAIDAEEWIAKKGIAAKGKKCHDREIKSVKFIEPLVKEEDLVENTTEAQVPAKVEPTIESSIEQDEESVEEPTLF